MSEVTLAGPSLPSWPAQSCQATTQQTFCSVRLSPLSLYLSASPWLFLCPIICLTMDSKAFSVTAKYCRLVPGSQAEWMQIQKRKEAKWGKFEGEVSLHHEQRSFPFDWNCLSLQFEGEGRHGHWVWKTETATLESSRFCNTPEKTEAPRLAVPQLQGTLLCTLLSDAPWIPGGALLRGSMSIFKWGRWDDTLTYCPRRFLYKGREG